MILVVLDTNVLASGVLHFDTAPTTPAIILRRWFAGGFSVATSAPLLAEFERTLANHYFASRIPPAVSAQWIAALPKLATETPLAVAVSGIATHSEDDIVLATAVSAAADYLVTGDRQLLKLGAYQGVQIISAAHFVAVLDQSSEAPPSDCRNDG